MITEQAQQRARILAFWERHGDTAAHEAFRVSRRTLYRWQKKLRETQGKLEGLNAGNCAPHIRRKRKIPSGIAERIIEFRTAHPRLGKDKIRALLVREGYRGSISTVGRILADLKAQNRIPIVSRYTLYGKTGRLVERKPLRRKKKLRRPTGCRVLEVDTVIRFIDGVKRYIITCIDTERRTAFAACYSNHGSASAADFLRKTVIILPECPTALQTDNGSEFGRHFEQAARNLSLTHFHIYPRSPKMNTHIERFNRTLDEEFLRYHRALLRDDISSLNERLVDWLLWYNGERPHYALGQISPFQSMMQTLTAEECHMWWTHTRG